MSIAEAVCKYPQTADIMMRYGMHCIGCQVAAMESISQGAAAHGLNKAQIAKMLKEMNAVAKRKR
jgi:hybrid cluster-associated redox disulfide protein